MGSNLYFKNNNLSNEPPEDDGGGERLTRPALTRQGSIYSLTFDEFQSSLGKDFGSMNMDELLKNIWSVEETQAMCIAPLSCSQEVLNLQRQGSLTLPRTISHKTVDQVWKDLSSKDGSNMSQSQAQMLGEVTLEEFLVRAGVVREDDNVVGSNTSFYVDFPQTSPSIVPGLVGNLGENTSVDHMRVQGSVVPLNVNGESTYKQQQQPIMPKQPCFGYETQMDQVNGIRSGIIGLGDQPIVPNNMVLGGSDVSPVTPVSRDGIRKSNNGDSWSLSPSPYNFNGGGGRGRKRGGIVEKVVERRQRRMIKNRESAARSRARKQAYTVELEAEVAKLNEENEELQRKQAKILEMQKNQEMEMMNLQGSLKKKLRRTESEPW
ncbi:unnamed protein product [Cochlearia groenlandica]